MHQLQLPGINPSYRLKIVRDNHPESPREWDNLGTMVCWHRRYDLGDEQPTQEPNEYREQLGEIIMLPLYLYDHSGITMSTGSFSCPWDSGQVGFIYVSRERVLAEYGWKRLTAKRRAKIEQYLTNEVKTYDDYLTGNVHGYEVEVQDNQSGEWEHEDSCWGFYGEDAEGVYDHVAPYGFTREQVKDAFGYGHIWFDGCEGKWVGSGNTGAAGATSTTGEAR